MSSRLVGLPGLILAGASLLILARGPWSPSAAGSGAPAIEWRADRSLWLHPQAGNDSTIHDLLALGRYCAASVLARKQLAERTARLGEDAAEVATARRTLGDVEMLQGDVVGARSLYEGAVKLHRKTLGADDPELAVSLDALGLAEKNLNNHEAASACYREAHAIRLRRFGPDHPSIAASLNREADLLRRLGRSDAALPVFLEALDILESASMSESPLAAEVLTNLGLVEYFLEDYRSAEPHLERAVRLVHEAPGVTRETAALATSLHGGTLWKLRKYAAAEPVLRESANIYEFLRRQGEPGALPYHPLSIYSALALTQLEQGEEDAAWRSLEQSLSRGLLDALDPPADSLEEWEEPRPPEDSRFCSLPRVQANLPEDAALVGWLTTYRSVRPIWDYPVWGYVIRREGPIRWIRIDGPETAESEDGNTAMYKLAVALDAEAGWPVRTPISSELSMRAQKSYDDLWLPLEPYLSGVSHLVVVRAFLEGRFNVEAMQDPQGKFLGERYRVSYTPSATLYVWMREHARSAKDPRTWRVLAVGGPESADDRVQPPHVPRSRALSTLPASMPSRDGAGSALPGSREEVRRLASCFPRCTTLLGQDASERNLMNLARSGALHTFDVIHLALHAGPDEHRASTSYLLFDGDDRGPSEDEPIAEGDRRISNWEIRSGWRLNADIVTISACRSSRTFQSTEALGGLGEAFFRAGARSLVVSPWDVDDTAASLLMERFYQNLSGSYRDERAGRVGEPMSKVMALYEARNWLRTYRDESGGQPFASPIYWAAFTLVGEAGE